jgi:hypothetical protein
MVGTGYAVVEDEGAGVAVGRLGSIGGDAAEDFGMLGQADLSAGAAVDGVGLVKTDCDPADGIVLKPWVLAGELKPG